MIPDLIREGIFSLGKKKGIEEGKGEKASAGGGGTGKCPPWKMWRGLVVTKESLLVLVGKGKGEKKGSGVENPEGLGNSRRKREEGESSWGAAGKELGRIGKILE